jgi:hypothetical protein
MLEYPEAPAAAQLMRHAADRHRTLTGEGGELEVHQHGFAERVEAHLPQRRECVLRTCQIHHIAEPAIPEPNPPHVWVGRIRHDAYSRIVLRGYWCTG